MTGTNRTGSIVVITESDERRSPLVTSLRTETRFSVETTEPDGELAKHLAGTGGGPDGVVVALDRAEAVRRTLDRVRDEASTVPTVVTPRDGDERIATAALRAGASEYVPADEEPIDRIVSTVRSDGETNHGSDATTDSTAVGDVLPTILDDIPDDAFVLDEDGTYLDVSTPPETPDLDTLSRDELLGSTLDDAFSEEIATRFRACIQRAIETGETQSIEYDLETTEGNRRFDAQVVPIGDSAPDAGAVLWIARDVTERVDRVRKLRSRRDRLETLDSINAAVREVIETLVEAPTREAIERGVCERLVDSELYCASLIAEWTGDRQLAYRTGAGGAERFLERVRDRPLGSQSPLVEAADTGEVKTVTDLPGSDVLPDDLREAATVDEVGSLLAVPIVHEDVTYGVLAVLASREEAFDDRERAEFRLLGETIGFTIQAVKNRQLLFADTVVELEFRIHGGDTFSFDLSEQYDCTCTLEWAGKTTDGTAFQFVTVDGLDGETVLAEGQAHDSVESCRLIHDGTNRCTIELQLSRSGVRTLANHGATIRDVSVTDGVGSCLVEVPQDADVRKIAEALTAVYENTDLVARREIDRPVQTAAERRTRILDQLTDRQLTTLRLAYYGGFFDWPRESTGEEVAEAMGVSPPTMHQHLRKGLKTVLGEFFEEGSGTE